MNTLARYGAKICFSAEVYKAWSQNLGHDDVLTTFTSYGEVPVERQGEIISNLALAESAESTDIELIAEEVARKLRVNNSN